VEQAEIVEAGRPAGEIGESPPTDRWAGAYVPLLLLSPGRACRAPAGGCVSLPSLRRGSRRRLGLDIWVKLVRAFYFI
jgi:hypothetical protein